MMTLLEPAMAVAVLPAVRSRYERFVTIARVSARFIAGQDSGPERNHPTGMSRWGGCRTVLD
jgi:hypothetical protein